jgi:hypothetical protein
MVAERHVLVFALHRREVNVMIVLSSQLVSVGPRLYATLTPVEAHPIDGDVVYNRRVVDVGDMKATEVGDGPVVIERATAPVTASETNAGVSITIVDATVESYVRAPVTRVPHVQPTTPSPVTRRP